MRVRQLIQERKTLRKATGWKSSKVPPRHAPVFSQTAPISGGWLWQSGQIENKNNNFVLHVRCNSTKDDWKAWLMISLNDGWSVVARLEYHANHPGLHLHSNYRSSGSLIGAESLSLNGRLPKGGGYHRRVCRWTPNGFWNKSLLFFRIEVPGGDLI